MALDMAIKAVIVISQRGFNQDDFHAVMQATARKNIITFVSALLKTGATGNNGEGILPNMKLDEITAGHYNAIVFISGGASAYHKNQHALRLAREFCGNGGIAAAIGDAVPVLANAELLEGMMAACDEADKRAIGDSAVLSDENVVRDGKIITAKTGCGKEFGEKLSEALAEIGLQEHGRKGIEL